MYKELIINNTDHETRVALLEDGTISELFIERGDESNINGNVYKGRVQRVLPGMQAAFIDIGLKQAAFIYVDDVFVSDYREFEEKLAEKADADENGELPEDSLHKWPDANQTCRIEDLLKEGQEVMVQVAKSPLGTKGARVTSHISLPGRYLVLMPTMDHIGVSRRIEDEEERNRLKELIQKLRREKFGYIFRTAAEGIDEDTLHKEMDFLLSLWKRIVYKNQKSSAPTLLHRDLTVTLRAVRDLLTHEANKLVIDSRQGYDVVKKFLGEVVPDLPVKMELYEGEEPIFDAYNLEGDISRALKKKIWLKSGGYIIIEHTEALVAIDVNTGRYVGKHNFEETILKTNLEAVKEIAYQVRLRNLGGIIIIDFIDMARPSNQEKVFNALREAMKKDKAKSNILPMSDMGLIQMTRKRVRKSLSRMLCEPCYYCDGSGQTLSRHSVCYKVYREILRYNQDATGERFAVHVNPEVAELLHGEESQIITSLESRFNKRILIYPCPEYHLEEFEIFEISK